MIEAGSRLGLTQEPLARFIIVAQRLGEKFEGDTAIESGVLGQVHFPHAAGADLADYLVVTNGLTDHSCPLWWELIPLIIPLVT